MSQRYVPKILVVAGIDLRREPFVPVDFFERTDWDCGMRGCGNLAEKVLAVPLGGQREFFGLCCAEHLGSYESQLAEALESESLRAAEFDAETQQVN